MDGERIGWIFRWVLLFVREDNQVFTLIELETDCAFGENNVTHIFNDPVEGTLDFSSLSLWFKVVASKA